MKDDGQGDGIGNRDGGWQSEMGQHGVKGEMTGEQVGGKGDWREGEEGGAQEGKMERTGWESGLEMARCNRSWREDEGGWPRGGKREMARVDREGDADTAGRKKRSGPATDRTRRGDQGQGGDRRYGKAVDKSGTTYQLKSD